MAREWAQWTLQKHCFNCLCFFPFRSRAGEARFFSTNVAPSHAIRSFLNKYFEILIKTNVSRENEHNGRFKSTVFTVYIFCGVAPVQAGRVLFSNT